MITNGQRLLTCYDPDDNNPEAHGFIKHSSAGLTSSELFFLQSGGREGLIDTGLKTKDTGNMHRHMIKGFENIVNSYYGSVRLTVGTLIAISYNRGYRVEAMISNGKRPSFINVRHMMRELNHSQGFVKESTMQKLASKPACTKLVISSKDTNPSHIQYQAMS